ncbi:hypothetical protein L6452_42223 [Arctium lappa]|uniref:Uncharacterized protein n=1 Tax=Arctium lappa TaxID=4217 RepID=A0ACB8XHP0_ARCLA|nr:hypothetical protein L6452_42223 [Arctium lappa]
MSVNEVLVDELVGPAEQVAARGRGRGRGRTPRSATTQVEETNTGNRGKTETHVSCRARSVVILVDRERPLNKKALQLPCSPTKRRRHREVRSTARVRKEFSACKLSTYKGECDPVLAMKWVKEMALLFDTSKCAEGDKVIYALYMLRSEAVLWWDADIGGQGSSAAKAVVNTAEMTEKEKNRQVTERVGDKRKWDGAVSDARKGKVFKTESRGAVDLGISLVGSVVMCIGENVDWR